jgi:hypothetical protein
MCLAGAEVPVLVDRARRYIRRVVRRQLEDARPFRLPHADREGAGGDVDDLVASVRVNRACFPARERQGGHGQVFGACKDAHERVPFEPVRDVLGPEPGQRRHVALRAREPPEERVVRIARLIEIVACACVCAGRARARRRCQELEHAQRLVAVGKDVMPRVRAEERALSGRHADDLGSLRVCKHHRSRQDVENLIGTEDGAELLRVPERGAGREPEREDVKLVRRRVDPVEHLARLGVAPDVPRHVGVRDRRGAVVAGPRRGAVRGHGRLRRVLDAHTSVLGSCTR